MGDLGDSLLGDPVIGGNIECATSLSAGNAQPVFDRIAVSAEPVSVENGCREVTDREEGLFDDDGAFAVGEGEYPVLEEALEVLEVAAKDDTNEFAGVLPLKTSGGDSGGADSAFCKNSGDDCPLMAAEDGFCGSSLPESCVPASAEGGVDGSNEKIADLFHIYPMETPIRSLRVEEGLTSEYTETQEGKREDDTGAALEENSASFEEDAGVEKCPSQQLESEVGDSVKVSSDKLTPCSAEEVSACGQACHLTTYVGNCFSKLSSNADNVTPACSKPTSVIVFRRSNPKRGASLRSCLSDKKSVHLTGIRNNGNKSVKAADARMSILSRISNKVTKKRSCSQRHGNPSVWGTSDSLLKIFKPTDDLASSDYDAIRIQNKCSKKRRSGKGKKEGQAARKDGRLSVLRCTTTGSSNSLPVKNKKSLHPFFRVTASSKSSVRTNLSDRRIHSHLQKRYGDVECKLEKDMNDSGINSVEPDGIKSVEPDGLHGDKDLESTLTQDISVESMHGEYPGASSPQESEALAEAIDERRLLDPGTSPDSGVYHPAMDAGAISSACATPTNRDAGMDGSALATELVAQCGLSTDVSAYSEVHILPTAVSPLDSQVHNNHEKGQQGKKNGEFDGYLCPLSEDLFNKQESSVLKSVNNCAKASEHRRAERRKQEASDEINPLCLESIKEEAAKGSNYISTQVKVSPHQTIENGSYEDPIKDEIGLQKRKVSGQNVVNSQLDEGNLAGSSLTDRAKACRLPRGSKAGDERVSHCPVSMRRRRRNAMVKKKEKIHKSGYKGKTSKKTITDDACKDTSGEMSSLLGVACRSDLTGSIALNSKTSSAVAPETDGKALEKSCNGLEGQPSRPRAAWVLCDDCQKWRCIPAELADLIDETKCKWTCKDNMNMAFADCSIPQEKTNSEINAELEISDGSGDEDGSRAQLNLNAVKATKTTASQPAPWALIKSNLFLHRNRKTQTIDEADPPIYRLSMDAAVKGLEVMVCHCKPPSNGSLGCGEECLNRMLNIECVRGTCPCGNLCLNQQFQKRKYAKLKSFRCGKKGYGLQLQEDVSCGQFLIEYVGEVLDFAAYEARQRYYAARGQKHFYFMTLNGGEVIDACDKGNLGRFINHSCDPNCRTEKWMVNGEVCIGLFAIRDLKKGEEVTFDYNYVRVFGAAAKKCVCGSVECRGYIGGDPLSSDAIVQCDSDEEYHEPMKVSGVDGRHLDGGGTSDDATDSKVVKLEDSHRHAPEHLRSHSHAQQEDLTSQCLPTTTESGPCLENKGTLQRVLSDAHQLDNSLENLDPKKSRDIISRPLPDIKVVDNSSHVSISTVSRSVSDVQRLEPCVATDNPASDFVLRDKKKLSKINEDKKKSSKRCPLAKSSHSNGLVKNARAGAKILAPQKAQKLPRASGSGQYEGVEQNLNDLLDEDGGISKRKDATKGYLKLLFVTAAEGDNIRGFASQSTRDLSLILDALLKTKSRMVLVDIINKNGLQMLHNIMKQNRNNFNRIPIIRKLLKVLEFLALKNILTLEHINRSPPCSGMESFRESILILTKHQDMQVQQIARNFRDKWMLRTIKRVEPSGRGDGQHSHCNWFQPSSFSYRHDQRTRDTDAVVCVSEAARPSRSSCEADHTGEKCLPLGQQAHPSLPSIDYSSANGTRICKRKSRWDNPSEAFSADPQSLWFNGDNTIEASSKFMKQSPCQLKQTSQLEVMGTKPETHAGETSSCGEVSSAKESTEQYVYEDAPPGFVSPRKSHHPQAALIPTTATSDMDMVHQHQKHDELPPGFGSPDKGYFPQIPSETFVVDGDAVMAHPQKRYMPHLTVSYGIPVSLMQDLGTHEVEGGSRCLPHWAIAAGVPFHPFPPLPSYPRAKSNRPGSRAHDVTTEQPKEKIQLGKRYHADVDDPSASGERRAHGEPRAKSSQITRRVRWCSEGSGRSFFRSPRWNDRRFQRARPPWSHEGNSIRYRGSTRNESSSRCIGNSRRHNSNGFSFQEGMGIDVIDSDFHQ